MRYDNREYRFCNVWHRQIVADDYSQEEWKSLVCERRHIQIITGYFTHTLKNGTGRGTPHNWLVFEEASGVWHRKWWEFRHHINFRRGSVPNVQISSRLVPNIFTDFFLYSPMTVQFGSFHAAKIFLFRITGFTVAYVFSCPRPPPPPFIAFRNTRGC